MPVTEALSDDEAYLLAILTDASGLDLAEFSWYDPVEEDLEDSVNDGCWRARPYQWTWWRDPSPLQIDQCVAGGQTVATLRGDVAIEEVVVGDSVLTHEGRYRQVTAVWDRGPQYVVAVTVDDVRLVVTPDHPFWTRRPRRWWQRRRRSADWMTPVEWDWDDPCAEVLVNGYAWVGVDRVEAIGVARVYDLDVDEDHSFTVEGIAVHNCARDVGKTLGIQARAFAFPYCHPGAELVVTAPELVHLEPLTSLIEQRFFGNRLGQEIMPKARSRITRRPFRMNFTTGARIIGRIPQVTGRGVKGLHPVALEADEMQDYPEAGWMELVATLRRGIKGAMWRAHGVTKGIRDKFWDFTQPSAENPWKVHRITAMHRDDWNDDERQRNIILYGSREAPDYRRNILGLHGDQTQALFVLHRLMRLCDTTEASKYNSEEYQRFTIRAEELEERAGPLQEDQAREAIAMLAFNPLAYEFYWSGADIGFTVDPTEIVVAAEYVPSAAEIRADLAAHRGIPEQGMTRVKVIARIHLARIANPTQAAIMRHVIGYFKPQAFGMDRTGAGIGLWQDLLATDLEMAKVVRGYHFSEKVIIGIDGTIEVTEREDVLKEAAILGNVLEVSTDKLRELVDNGRWMMPYDREMLREFQGQTWQYSKAIMDAYGRRSRTFSTGTFHALDACRMLAMAHAQAPIEAFIADHKADTREAVLDQFMPMG